MKNNCCRFNFCPLIIALFIGAIIAFLVFGGTIAIATVTTLLPYIFVVSLVTISIVAFIVIGLIYSNAVENIEIPSRCCLSCCICPLLKTTIFSSVILLITTLIGLAATVGTTAVTAIISILIFVIFTALAFTIFTLLELINCTINELCS